jgi:hypothetical protein
MANQVLNSARRHFMAGSGGIALCAGLPLRRLSTTASCKDKGRAEEQLLFVSERWGSASGERRQDSWMCAGEPSCPDRGARNMNTFRWTQQKSCRACRPPPHWWSEWGKRFDLQRSNSKGLADRCA